MLASNEEYEIPVWLDEKTETIESARLQKTSSLMEVRGKTAGLESKPSTAFAGAT